MPRQPTELNITDLVPDATAGDVTALGGTMDLATFDHRLPLWLDRLYGDQSTSANAGSLLPFRRDGDTHREELGVPVACQP